MEAITRPADGLRRVLVAAAVLCGVAALTGVVRLLGGHTGYYAGTLLSDLVSPGQVAFTQTVAALTGTAAGILGAAGALSRRAVAVLGVVHLAIFGIALQSYDTLATVGYLVALAVPLLVLGLLVQVVRRYRTARWVVGVPGLVAVVAGAVVGREPLWELLGYLVPGLARQAWMIGTTLLLLGVGALWGLATVRAVAATDGARRATAWVVRNRRAITVVAATGPLPYALIRLTWLTPWPVGSPGGLDLPTRIWGLTLSSGAWAGVVLTLGLMLPWGERFPRWFPGRAGQPVPVLAAALPGGLVAATLTFSALPVVVGTTGVEKAWMGLLVFPCWYWGPALALAVWGYVAHRRGEGTMVG